MAIMVIGRGVRVTGVMVDGVTMVLGVRVTGVMVEEVVLGVRLTGHRGYRRWHLFRSALGGPGFLGLSGLKLD
jgi:hypothetical protein